MFRHHAVSLLAAGLPLLLAAPRAAEAQVAAPSGTAEPARPAVLVVPAWDGLERFPAAPPRRAVEPPRQARSRPRGVPLVPMDQDRSHGPPRVPGYRCIDSFQPNPLTPHLRYYVYLDLNNAAAVRNWQEFQRVQRQEAREARAAERNERAFEQRGLHLLSEHEEAVAEGLAAFRAGDYRQATIDLTRAAELHQGDPACRIHLAQAHLALGHDADAAKALRRALQLQPKLVPKRLNLAQYYPRPDELDAHVDALSRRIAAKRTAAADEYLLLGFMEFQRGRTDEAYAAFRYAVRGRKADSIVETYLKLTKPAQP